MVIDTRDRDRKAEKGMIEREEGQRGEDRDGDRERDGQRDRGQQK